MNILRYIIKIRLIMESINSELVQYIFLYLDKKSKYNFIQVNKNLNNELKRHMYLNVPEHIFYKLGIDKSDLNDNFLIEYLREHSLELIKDIVEILEQVSSSKKLLKDIQYIGLKALKLQNMNLDDCKNYIKSNESDGKIRLLVSDKKKLKINLWKKFRNVYCLLI